MRTQLRAKGTDVRSEYSGIFQRFGIKSGYKSPLPTFVIDNVRDESNTLITDHLWLNFTTTFNKFGWLKPGDIVTFRGRVKSYRKGYFHDNIDYRLTYPSQVSIIRNGKTLPITNALKNKAPFELCNIINANTFSQETK